MVTDDGWILPDKDGGFSITFDLLPSGGVVARLDERTGEMTLERQEDHAVILATRNPDAFHAGVELLREKRMITWLGFALVPNRIYVMRQVQP